jgi:hypothetical protein
MACYGDSLTLLHTSILIENTINISKQSLQIQSPHYHMIGLHVLGQTVYQQRLILHADWGQESQV